jgi:hypothetical protein
VEIRGFWALGVPSKREKHKNIKGPIYKQNKSCCQVRGAFERRELRSNVLPHAFDVLVRV